MRTHLTTVAFLVLASAASCRSHVQPSDTLLTARDVLMLPYRSDASSGLLVRRQAVQRGGGSVQLTPDRDGNNVTDYDKNTNAACIDALRKLPRSTNPSGNCLCYNLPSLDTNSGNFEADLRVFRVSDPRDDFVGISPSDINVGVQYTGASVTLASPQQIQNMLSRQSTIGRRQENRGPELVQSYMFVGQIDPNLLSNNLSLADLEIPLMPVFRLTAKDATGRTVSTNVSLNEASFVTGVFSDQVVQSDFGAAQAAVDNKRAAVRNSTAAFVLPGVQIMIFPVGLIITSVWVLIGVTAYGIGTYQRALYAKAWRRRTRVAAQIHGKPI